MYPGGTIALVATLALAPPLALPFTHSGPDSAEPVGFVMTGDRDAGAGTPGRVLGIDLGERRIGVAVGDLDAGVAMPLTTLSRGRSIAQDALVISRLASEQRAVGLVVGLPLDMDGGEGLQAIRTREWAVAVGDVTGLPVRFRDERLSSERAERRVGLPARGRSGGPPTAAQRDGHRARIDREAAVLILQDELDATMTEKREPKT